MKRNKKLPFFNSVVGGRGGGGWRWRGVFFLNSAARGVLLCSLFVCLFSFPPASLFPPFSPFFRPRVGDEHRGGEEVKKKIEKDEPKPCLNHLEGKSAS